MYTNSGRVNATNYSILWVENPCIFAQEHILVGKFPVLYGFV